MASELTAADITAIVAAVRSGGLENVLLAVGFGCEQKARTLGGVAHDAWLQGRKICNEAADKAREVGL